MSRRLDDARVDNPTFGDSRESSYEYGQGATDRARRQDARAGVDMGEGGLVRAGMHRVGD